MLTSPRWYLLQCKAQQQARAELNLTHQGFTCYAPVHTVKRLARGKVGTRKEALFIGYLFIKLSEESNWGALRSTRGVNRIVGFNGAPHPVPDSLIAALQQRLAAPAAPAVLFKSGERVVITEGCFKHVEAIVKAVTTDERIVVLLNILNSQQTLAMQATQLTKAG
tara:strand:+ start:831 stop:1328 length:498 start_codon:yes stop_codon:yes gene_type:complete